MYIVPETTFKVLKGVPFNSDYQHTILFDNETEQINYMLNKAVKTFTDFTYVRQDGYVRVPVIADSIYDCNYCMFKNTRFGNKWFYGFITSIEYVNNVTTAIHFEIDYFQTWLFNFNVGTSFVEREHVADDTVGKHTVEESIGYGDVIVQDSSEHLLTDMSVVIQATPNLTSYLIEAIKGNETPEVPTQGSFMQNMYVGGSFIHAPALEVSLETINAQINQLLVSGYSIANIFMCPTEFFTAVNPNTFEIPNTRPSMFIFGGESYKPRNNKLLCYPYTYLRVGNHQGGSIDYKWEYLLSNGFRLSNSYVTKASCLLEPRAYEISGNRNNIGITIDNFPVCSWSENQFLQYIGQQGLTDAIKMTSSDYGHTVTQPKASTSTTAYKTPGTDVYNANEAIKSIVGDFGSIPSGFTLKGSGGNSYIDVATNSIGFYFFTMGIKPEMARIVDDYFTRFGYQINRYKVPSLKSRTSFNYVKTVECNITGDAPNEALRVISSIFDSGITLWHVADVGNYSLDNSIKE